LFIKIYIAGHFSWTNLQKKKRIAQFIVIEVIILAVHTCPFAQKQSQLCGLEKNSSFYYIVGS